MFLIVFAALMLSTIIGPLMIVSNASYWECYGQQMEFENEGEVKKAEEIEPEVVKPEESVEETSINQSTTRMPKAKVMPLSFVSSALLEENENWTEMYVRRDIVNVYMEDNEDAFYGTLTLGEMVEVSSEAVADGWVKIRKAGEEGYVKSSDVSTLEEFLQEYQYLLAQIIYCEAGGVSKAEMELVGEVVLNRLVTTYWEFDELHTLMEVLEQHNQYSETLGKIRNGLVPSEDAMEVAKELLLGMDNDRLPDDCYWQTGFYPTWNVTVILETESHYYSVPK